MAPRKFGVLGYAFDFLAMAGIFYTAIFGVSTIVFGLGKFGLLTYARAPLVVAAHSFCYLYCLLHTAFVVGAHIGMFAGAKAVVAYNNGEGAPPNGVPEKSYHYVMWCEQAAGDKPRARTRDDAHTWPPLVYIPPLGVPHYMRGYLLVDLPGIALLLVGSPKAYAAIWGCYLCAALTDHLTLFGGQFKDRIKTVLPVGGINMAQYAFWTVATHLHAPGRGRCYRVLQGARHDCRRRRSGASGDDGGDWRAAVAPREWRQEERVMVWTIPVDAAAAVVCHMCDDADGA